MIKAVLIDDEKIALEQLEYVLNQYREIEVLATFTDPFEALKIISTIKPDVIFMDIEMPAVNGFMIAEEIRRISPGSAIVFINGFDDYAIKAFEIDVTDFILKPVSKVRIDRTIERITDYLEKKVVPEAKFNHLFKQNMTKVLVREGDNFTVLNPANILFFTFLGRNVTVVTKQRQYKTKQTLNYWEDRLKDMNFYRCHRSYLVNLDKIEKILLMFNNAYFLKMSDYAEEIPVSRKNINSLKQILGLI